MAAILGRSPHVRDGFRALAGDLAGSRDALLIYQMANQRVTRLAHVERSGRDCSQRDTRGAKFSIVEHNLHACTHHRYVHFISGDEPQISRS